MTLIEVLVVIGVLGLLIGASVGLFTRSLRSVGKTSAIIETEDSAQLALALLDRNIKNARRVVAVGAGGCPGTGNTLSLRMADGGLMVLSLADGKIASNGASLTGERTTITNLSFECTSNGSAATKIIIDFDAGFAETDTGVVSVKHYNQEVSLRNF